MRLASDSAVSVALSTPSVILDMSSNSETRSTTALESKAPRPLFSYGTPRALPLLAWAITGDCKQTTLVATLVQPARVRICPVISPRQRLSGRCQRVKLDDLEVETYKPTPVVVEVLKSGPGLDSEKEVVEVVDADIYLWDGEHDALSGEDWDLATVVRERLNEWLDLFGGMELVGDADVVLDQLHECIVLDLPFRRGGFGHGCRNHAVNEHLIPLWALACVYQWFVHPSQRQSRQTCERM
ncbi:hypothetical protein OH77DRAFT_1150420 [Trametes cingulata]|nr:hypothetical protein OH77DRAFT_1150420 [Trametes cingulata]